MPSYRSKGRRSSSSIGCARRSRRGRRRRGGDLRRACRFRPRHGLALRTSSATTREVSSAECLRADGGARPRQPPSAPIADVPEYEGTVARRVRTRVRVRRARRENARDPGDRGQLRRPRRQPRSGDAGAAAAGVDVQADRLFVRAPLAPIHAGDAGRPHPRRVRGWLPAEQFRGMARARPATVARGARQQREHRRRPSAP